MNANKNKVWNYEHDYADTAYQIYLTAISEYYEKNDYISIIKIIIGFHYIEELMRNKKT